MTEELQTAYAEALSAEYAAVYAYGVVGAQVPPSERSAAESAIAAHRAARDNLRTAMAAAGLVAPAPAAAYQTGEVDTPEAARALAVDVELALVPRYSALAGRLDGAKRGWCATQAQQCATRALTWGASSQAFPGVQQPAADQPTPN